MCQTSAWVCSTTANICQQPKTVFARMLLRQPVVLLQPDVTLSCGRLVQMLP